MSSDGFFDEDLDSAVFEQLDAIESAHFSPKRLVASGSRPLAQDDSFSDLTFDIDEQQLEMLDAQVADTYAGRINAPVSNGVSRNGSMGTIQTTLFGSVAVLPPAKSKAPPNKQPTMQRTNSTSHNIFGHRSAKTKQWDQTIFAKTGLNRPKASKDKSKGGRDDQDEEEDEGEGEELEFEQFPAPFVPSEWMNVWIGNVLLTQPSRVRPPFSLGPYHSYLIICFPFHRPVSHYQRLTTFFDALLSPLP